MTHVWVNQHSDECPVTHGRRGLLADIEADTGTGRDGLLGAVPEYDGGGDQEAELCTCGGYGRALVANALRQYAEGVRENLDDDLDGREVDEGEYPVVEDYLADADRIAAGEKPVHDFTVEVLQDDTGPMALLEPYEVAEYKRTLGIAP